jgi:hypothetical protein
MSKGADITKLKKVRTPKATAAFAYLNKPDTSFNKSRYRITLLFDKKDPEFAAFVKDVAAAAKAVGVTKKGLPFKLANERLAEVTKVEVGTPYIEMTTNCKEGDDPVPVFNAKGQKDDTADVWGGDIVRAEGSLCKWELASGSGIKLYLNAVQLLKASARAGACGSTFEVEEEYATEDEGNTAPDIEESSDDNLEDEGDLFTDATDGDDSDDDPTAGLL